MPTTKSVLIFESFYALIGGNQRYIPMLLEQGKNSPWRVSLTAAGEGMLTDAARATGADVHVLPQPARLDRDRRGILEAGLCDKFLIAFSILFYNLRFYALLKRMKPDVVQCHSTRNALITGIATKLARVPMILFVKGELETPRFDDIALWLADHVMFISNRLRPARYRRLFEKHPDRFSLLRLGFDQREIDAAMQRTANSTPQAVVIEPGSVNFAYAGILREAKGVHVLIQAFAAVVRQHPECRLHILGTPEGETYPQRLRDMVTSLGLEDEVNFLGWRNDALDVLSVMDVCVLPSLAEGTPRSLVEAMALGKPVVATRVGGIPELFDDGRIGLLAEPSDCDSLAEALLRVAADSDLRARLGKLGQTEVRTKYAFDVHLKTWWSVLDHVSQQ